MRVTVRFFGSLRDLAGREREIALDDGSRIEELFSKIVEASPELEEILGTVRKGFPEDLIVLRNGRNVESLGGTMAPLLDGDVIAIFRSLNGG